MSFYLAVCCGAIALASFVWAAPPEKRGAKGEPKVTRSPRPMPATVEVKPAKKLDSLPSIEKKIVPIEPMAKPAPKVEPKVFGKSDPIIGVPLVLPRPIGIEKTPSTGGIKLPAGAKFDVAELAKIKPPVDLTKTSGDKLVKMKPPVDFKVKTVDLAKIHVPSDAVKVAKLGGKMDFKGEKFILSTDFYKGTDYHLKFGKKGAFGWYYPGHHHHHWHHCVWDPSCGCYYYYDPCVSCYYYWCATDVCYYPCWWFVDYCGAYYPWWLCGGFDHWGYHHHHHHGRFAIRIGW
jgi:hypothetical protein